MEANLQTASTPQQLKSAVDFLPLSRHNPSYNEQVRDLLITKKDLIVDAATADSVVKFLFNFSFVEAHPLLLRTNQVRDLIIKHIAPHVTAIEEFGRLICNINRQKTDLFCNVESFSAILKCFHRSKTSDDVRVVAASINNILHHNLSLNKLFNSLPVVEAFSFIIPLANDADAVRCISDALNKILNKNEEAQKKFGTAEFLKILRGMEKHATTDESKTAFRNALGFSNSFDFSKPLANATNSSQLKSAVDSLPPKEKFFTAQVRDLFIAKKHLIVDAETANSVVKFLRSFSEDEYRCFQLQTKEVRDLIVNNIATHVTAIEEFGSLICSIVQDQPSAVLFTNVESFAAILKCFHRSRTSNDARWIAGFINNILDDSPSANKLLNSLPVVEAFSFIIPLANDDEAVRWISNALMKILENNEEAQKKFATAEFLKIFEGMEKHAATDASSAPLKFVVNLLKPLAEHREASKNSLADATSPQQLISTLDFIFKQQEQSPASIELLLQKQHLIQDEETAIAVANFIKRFGEQDLKSIAKKAIFEMIENVLIPKFNNNNRDPIFDALAILFEEESARSYFSKASFRDFVSSSLSSAGNSLVKSLDLLLSNDNNNTAKEVFGTPEFKKLFMSDFRGDISIEPSTVIRVIKMMDEAIAKARFE